MIWHFCQVKWHSSWRRKMAFTQNARGIASWFWRAYIWNAIHDWGRPAFYTRKPAENHHYLKIPKTPTRWAYNNHFHNIWTNIHFFLPHTTPALASALKDAEKRWKMNRHEVSAVFSGEQGCLMRWCYFNSLFSSNTFYTTSSRGFSFPMILCIIWNIDVRQDWYFDPALRNYSYFLNQYRAWNFGLWLPDSLRKGRLCTI